ncbi:MAG: ABC transporter permease [Ilumatobacteraceae bacterium]
MSTPAPVRVWESHMRLYRTIWRSNVMGALFQPFLYLLGMGVGVGSLVDRGSNSGRLLDGLTYFQFLAPSLIATAAMMVSSSEAMWPVLGGFKWQSGFHAAAATPLSPGEIQAGVALWHATKALIAASGVALVLALFSETRSIGLPLAVVFGGLTGLAFSSVIVAWTATREQDYSFPNINRFVITPLFLFGGAFYPISQLPGWLQWVAKATPLWHGVELTRGAVNERLEWGSTMVHVGYLVLFVAAGWLSARRSFQRRLGQ